MKLTIEPTKAFFMAGDVMVRMWQGTDSESQPVVALVSAVVFPGQAEAATEGLVSIPPPAPDDAARWARTVLAGFGEGTQQHDQGSPVSENDAEAHVLLNLINAEFQSDPTSVRCFDLRIVERVKQCVAKRKAQPTVS